MCLSLSIWVSGQLTVYALEQKYLEAAPFQPTALVLGTEDQHSVGEIETSEMRLFTGLRAQLSLFPWFPLTFSHIPCKMPMLMLESSLPKELPSLSPRGALLCLATPRILMSMEVLSACEDKWEGGL